MSTATRRQFPIFCLLLASLLVPALSWAESFRIKTVASGPGRIVSESGSKTVETGGDLTFTFEPRNDAFEVSDVKVDGASVGSLTGYTFVDVQAKHKLVVVFKKKILTVSAGIRGDAQGGNLRPFGDFLVPYGGAKSFRAKPAAGMVASLFVDNQWKKDGQPGKALRYTLKPVKEDHVVSVVFSQGVANHPPVAVPLSLTADPSVPLVKAQLIGVDADHDTLSFDLVGGSSGTGYEQAAVDSVTGLLNAIVTATPPATVEIPFHVSDQKGFGNEAKVTILVQEPGGDKGTGGQTVDPKTYAGFDRTHLSSDLLGAPGEPPTEPKSVDLSPNFPTPGDQGQQGSCVAWATGYALKSYQEGVEMGWSLDTTDHLFSPAFIYNQVNGGQDGGSQIFDALDLIINQGAATWNLMPYTDQDFRNQPSAAVQAEAAKFKGLKRYTLSTLSDLKGALAQRKPVVLGIEVFDQFYNLRGTDSVYNSDQGSNTGQHGRHAVTAVGYDNERYGGAVKVINSWSTSWGDSGFFWMPYDFLPKVTFQMWVLDDGPNGDVTPTPDPPAPPPSGDLPDLQVVSWNAQFDTNLGGSGKLAYEIRNGGAGTVPTGVASVAFLLSKDDRITAADTYVVYEQIPFEMVPGDKVYRCYADIPGCDPVDENPIGFEIPPTLEPGVYYLGLLLDDIDAVAETDESNNAAVSDGTSTFTNNSADLEVNTWYVEWDDAGQAALTYEIANIGGATVPPGWFADLVLSDSEFLTNPIVLAFDEFPQPLDPNRSYYRDGSAEAPAYQFDIYKDAAGQPYPAGFYYMAFVADYTGAIFESDELNNISFSNTWFYNPFGFGAERRQLSLPLQLGLKGADGLATGAEKEAYNGRRLPTLVGGVRRVLISENAAGVRSMEFLPEPTGDGPAQVTTSDRRFGKSLRSADKSVFPTHSRRPMPGGAAP